MKITLRKIMPLFLILFISCEKKDSIEIYLTNKRVESYDGVSLKTAVKDFLIFEKIIKQYGHNLRYDTIKDQIIYMGRFNPTVNDLNAKPFIKDSEIIGLDIKNSRIHFKESVQNRIYDSLSNWNKKGDFTGKQFVICLNGKIASSGYFDSMWNKYYCKTNRILFFPDKYDTSKKVKFLIDSSNISIHKLDKKSSLLAIFKSRLTN